MASYFLVRQARGPDWDPSLGRREQAGWEDHVAFIDRLTDEGRVVLGGPLGDVDGHYVALVVEAPGEAEARALFADDPWMDRILRIDSVEPWSLWIRARGFGAP